MAYGGRHRLAVSSLLAVGINAAVPERYTSMGGPALSDQPARSPMPRFVTQQQDHFDGSNSNTWQQAYYVNDTFWKDGSSAPVFLCVGGEGPPLDGSAVVASVHCNVAVEWLKETGALMFALEHRYYGCHNVSACPVSDLTVPGALKFHSSRQALADIAGFVEFANQKYKLSSANRWVTWGGSYPGMLAGWARLKFPHLIHAAVSSSAPVRAELDMQGYNNVVAKAYSVDHERVGGSPACKQAIADGHQKVGEYLGTDAGRDILSQLFGQSADWYADRQNQVSFAGQGVASFPAQSNDPLCTEDLCNIAKICAVMTNTSIGDEVHRLAKLRGQQQSVHLKASKPKVFEEPAPGYNDGEQLWAWQTCTEFGFYQTCEVGSECFFTQGLATLDEEMAFCAASFNISKREVASNINFSNVYYGGDHPQGSRVLYVNGEVDPWHANSVNRPLSQDLPALWVLGASHHAWTHPSQTCDQDSVIAARSKIRSIVQQWLTEIDDAGSVVI